MAALTRAWQEAEQRYQREHVMPYLYDDIGVNFDQPSRFRVLQIDHERDLGALRWTVDTPIDLEVVRKIFSSFSGKDNFSWLDVVDLFERDPELGTLNASVVHKDVYDFDRRVKD
jgi:spore coat polysaccharide biosynthesis protein SpsF (cytidylyltransferase family)